MAFCYVRCKLCNFKSQFRKTGSDFGQVAGAEQLFSLMIFEHKIIWSFSTEAPFDFLNVLQEYNLFALFEKRIIGNVDGVSLNFHIGSAHIVNFNHEGNAKDAKNCKNNETAKKIFHGDHNNAKQNDKCKKCTYDN